MHIWRVCRKGDKQKLAVRGAPKTAGSILKGGCSAVQPPPLPLTQLLPLRQRERDDRRSHHHNTPVFQAPCLLLLLQAAASPGAVASLADVLVCGSTAAAQGRSRRQHNINVQPLCGTAGLPANVGAACKHPRGVPKLQLLAASWSPHLRCGSPVP